MSILSQVSKASSRPIIGTILGEAGVGKTSLATSFPKPIVIRAEDGVFRQSKLVESPDVFPVARKADDVFDQLLALLNENHDYQTLVVDSTTALDTLFTASILEKDKATTLARACGGYGAGVELLANMHGRVRKAAGLLNQRKNMTVWFIAHADLESMRLPDQDDYLRYSLRLSKRAITYYVDDVDFVGHVRLASVLRGKDDERKRVISTGDREIVCHASAASVSKNPWSIVDPLDFPEGSNPLAPYLSPEGKRTRKRKEEPEPEAADADEYDGDGGVE